MSVVLNTKRIIRRLQYYGDKRLEYHLNEIATLIGLFTLFVVQAEPLLLTRWEWG